MDIEKHIAYWRNGAQEDIEAAEELVTRGRHRHALFFAHLAVEKTLKARVARVTEAVPPKIHNLVRLSELAEVALPRDEMVFLARLNSYQMAGRYPEEYNDVPISEELAKSILSRAEEIMEWLMREL